MRDIYGALCLFDTFASPHLLSVASAAVLMMLS